nr:unnamed protein product [Leishmania braziliensis]
MPTTANSSASTPPAPSVPAAAPTLEENPSTPTHTSVNHIFEELCGSYVEKYMLHRNQIVHQIALQARNSINVQSMSVVKGQAAVTAAVSPSLVVPPELAREYARMKEEALAHSHRHNAPAEPSARGTEELEAENAYLRALVLRLEGQLQPPTSCEAQSDEIVSSLPSSCPAPGHDGVPATNHLRSPSAAPPDQLAKGSAALYNSLLSRSGSAASPPPVTSHQVSDLQEQIDLLREAVQELSQRASVRGGHSSSPVPADAAEASLRLRAISPFPRCATPTCTTDVRTLQRIILHQQQTIRTLEQEMEDVHTAKTQMERAMTQLREATASIAAREKGGTEDEDVGVLGATAHWRSTCQTEDRFSDCIPVAESTVYGYAGQDAVDSVCHDTASVAADGSTAAQEMHMMDVEAAAEQVPEKRRAATFGGMRPPLWFDSTTSVADPTRQPDVVAGEDECEDESSSGTLTPMPRRTVVLHQRFSSAIGDSFSVCGRISADESPFARHTQMSCGTASNRRTSAAGSFTAL